MTMASQAYVKKSSPGSTQLPTSRHLLSPSQPLIVTSVTYIHTRINRLWSPLAYGLGGNNRLWSPLAYGLGGNNRLWSPLAYSLGGNNRLWSPLAYGLGGNNRLWSPLAFGLGGNNCLWSPLAYGLGGNKIANRSGAPRPPMTDVGTETAFRLDQRKHFRKSKHLLRSEVS